jgi:hypothetical protein
MQQNYESANAMAARCVDTSARLREFLFSGQELAWTVRRDIAAAANQLVALSLELEKGYRGNDDTAEVLDTAPRGLAPSIA